MALQTFNKKQGDELDYSIDWSAWLGSDTISNSSWSVPAGIDDTLETNSTTVGTVWLAGGSLGGSYECANTIVTAAGRTKSESIIINISGP